MGGRCAPSERLCNFHLLASGLCILSAGVHPALLAHSTEFLEVDRRSRSFESVSIHSWGTTSGSYSYTSCSRNDLCSPTARGNNQGGDDLPTYRPVGSILGRRRHRDFDYYCASCAFSCSGRSGWLF